MDGMGDGQSLAHQLTGACRRLCISPGYWPDPQIPAINKYQAGNPNPPPLPYRVQPRQPAVGCAIRTNGFKLAFQSKDALNGFSTRSPGEERGASVGAGYSRGASGGSVEPQQEEWPS
jgi:hypothetical protein